MTTALLKWTDRCLIKHLPKKNTGAHTGEKSTSYIDVNLHSIRLCFVEKLLQAQRLYSLFFDGNKKQWYKYWSPLKTVASEHLVI